MSWCYVNVTPRPRRFPSIRSSCLAGGRSCTWLLLVWLTAVAWSKLTVVSAYDFPKSEGHIFGPTLVYGGDDVLLECLRPLDFMNNIMPPVWLKPERTGLRAHYEEDRSETFVVRGQHFLQIRRTQSDDSGEYGCSQIYSDARGIVRQFSAVVNITILPLPLDDAVPIGHPFIGMTTVRPVLGHVLQAVCAFRGAPPMEYAWSCSGLDVAASPRAVADRYTGLLRIYNLTWSDAGTCTCRPAVHRHEVQDATASFSFAINKRFPKPTTIEFNSANLQYTFGYPDVGPPPAQCQVRMKSNSTKINRVIPCWAAASSTGQQLVHFQVARDILWPNETAFLRSILGRSVKLQVAFVGEEIGYYSTQHRVDYPAVPQLPDPNFEVDELKSANETSTGLKVQVSFHAQRKDRSYMSVTSYQAYACCMIGDDDFTSCGDPANRKSGQQWLHLDSRNISAASASLPFTIRFRSTDSQPLYKGRVSGGKIFYRVVLVLYALDGILSYTVAGAYYIEPQYGPYNVTGVANTTTTRTTTSTTTAPPMTKPGCRLPPHLQSPVHHRMVHIGFDGTRKFTCDEEKSMTKWELKNRLEQFFQSMCECNMSRVTEHEAAFTQRSRTTCGNGNNARTEKIGYELHLAIDHCSFLRHISTTLANLNGELLLSASSGDTLGVDFLCVNFTELPPDACPGLAGTDSHSQEDLYRCLVKGEGHFKKYEPLPELPLCPAYTPLRSTEPSSSETVPPYILTAAMTTGGGGGLGAEEVNWQGEDTTKLTPGTVVIIAICSSFVLVVAIVLLACWRKRQRLARGAALDMEDRTNNNPSSAAERSKAAVEFLPATVDIDLRDSVGNDDNSFAPTPTTASTYAPELTVCDKAAQTTHPSVGHIQAHSHVQSPLAITAETHRLDTAAGNSTLALPVNFATACSHNRSTLSLGQNHSERKDRGSSGSLKCSWNASKSCPSLGSSGDSVECSAL